jgi:hypothetical protein
MSGANAAATNPSLAIPAVSESIDQLRQAWLLKHEHVSAGTPAYWTMRAKERDAIFEPDNNSIICEEDLSDQPDEFTYPLSAWQAIHELHGWTFRAQKEWKSANIGLNGQVYSNKPWLKLTQESRNTWFRDGVFPAAYYI